MHHVAQTTTAKFNLPALSAYIPFCAAIVSKVPPPLCPINPYVQATLGVGSVNVCTVYFGSVIFKWSYCVPRVVSDTLVLRCMMFIFCVKEFCLSRPRGHL